MEAKSNYPGVWQGTLGGLWAALEQTQNFSDNPCDTSEHISDLNMTYQIPLTALIEDRQQFEQQFKQIVSDRNAFIHPRRPPRAPHPRQSCPIEMPLIRSVLLRKDCIQCGKRIAGQSVFKKNTLIRWLRGCANAYFINSIR